MNVQILAIPYDTAHRGQRMGRGPEHLLGHGLAAALEERGHDVRVELVETESKFPAEIATAFELHRLLAECVRRAVADGRFPLVLSGNCGSAVGTLAGLGTADTGVVWFDGHGDFNTPETTTTGFLDGMALSIVTGRCWGALAATIPGFEPVSESCVALAAARDLDPLERTALERSHITIVPAEPLTRAGWRAVLEPALRQLRGRVPRVYLHIDLDVLDPADARANGLAPPGGLSTAQLIDALRLVGETGPINAAAITAYDPGCDADGAALRAAMRVIDTIIESVETRRVRVRNAVSASGDG